MENANTELCGIEVNHTIEEMAKAYDELVNAKRKYEDAVNRNAGISVNRERYRNVLQNNGDVLVDMYRELDFVRSLNEQLEEEIDSLRSALKAADEEFNTVVKELNTLKAQTPSKPKTSKTKTD